MNQDSAIPVFRPDITQEEIESVVATLQSGWIGGGPRAIEFERRFAQIIGVRFAVSTSSGTAALQTALAALGVGPEDEIILPSFTWISAFQVIRALGATPVFADIEPDYLTLDTEDVQRVITPRTRGIIVVHHGGQLADLDNLTRLARTHGLWLLEDAAHACGAAYGDRPVGSMGNVTCFSFSAMKNLTTGDGGMVTTDSEHIARRLRLYRSLGIDRDTYTRYVRDDQGCSWVYDVISEGQRLHMNDIAAAIGLVQLSRLEEMNRKRGRLVQRYREAFSDLTAVRAVGARPGTQPSHHMFTLLMPDRDSFIEAMHAHGIRIGVHYIPIHRFSAARRYTRALPVTEEIWREVATLPLYPAMTKFEQDCVIQAARDIAIGGAGLHANQAFRARL